MTGHRLDAPPLGEPWICGRCGGVRGAHYLTCPVLRLPQDAPLWGDDGTAQ